MQRGIVKVQIYNYIQQAMHPMQSVVQMTK